MPKKHHQFCLAAIVHAAIVDELFHLGMFRPGREINQQTQFDFCVPRGEPISLSGTAHEKALHFYEEFGFQCVVTLLFRHYKLELGKKRALRYARSTRTCSVEFRVLQPGNLSARTLTGYGIDEKGRNFISFSQGVIHVDRIFSHVMSTLRQ